MASDLQPVPPRGGQQHFDQRVFELLRIQSTAGSTGRDRRRG
jgi:hypothetical protein